MTSSEVLLPRAGGLPSWMKTTGYKIPLIVVSLLLLVVIWESSPPSLLDYSSLPASQLQNLFSGQSANTSSDNSAPGYDVQHDSAPAVVPVVHTDSPVTEEESSEPHEPKKRPIETVKPDPNLAKSDSPVNTTVSDSTANPVIAPLDPLAEEDTQLLPANTTSVANSTTSTIEATSRVSEEDTQLVEEPVIQDDPQHTEGDKYIIPMLSSHVGTGNQVMEYRSAATIARTINRTLCLIPFFGGPDRHFGHLGDRHSGLVMEDRYDTEVLSKYVKVASMAECLEKCNKRLDIFWRLKNSRPFKWELYFNETPRASITFTREARKWHSTADVAAALIPLNEPKCVGLGGLFPGLGWRGVRIAASTYMQHSQRVMKAADIFQKRALGSNDHNYVSVHWRFEESNCRGHPLGLCFSRCGDGAVIANGRPSDTWDNMTHEGRKEFSKNGFNGVFVTQEDMSGAIYSRAVKHGVRNVYLSTDGWLRGKESSAILKWVVEDVRSKGVNIAGLWMIPGLPNFADGYYVEAKNVAKLFGLNAKEAVSNHMIALVEQEICLRSSVFLGSGQSSWSLAVSNTRRGRRCKEELNERITELDLRTPPELMEQAVIDKILSIQYTPGPTCRGKPNATIPNWEDEVPDGWIDYDSCETRLLNGEGQCRRITT